jgi:hypothetical protein
MSNDINNRVSELVELQGSTQKHLYKHLSDREQAVLAG